MKQLLLFCGLVFLLCSAGPRPMAQERSPEQIVRSVAARIIDSTSFRFMDFQTKARYAAFTDLPATTTDIRTASQYNKWEYANGVLNIGMMRAGAVLNDKTYINYSLKNFDFIFSNLDHFKERYAQNPKTEWAAWFRMSSLDDCGAMAAALADVQALAASRQYMAYLQRAADYIMNRQARLKDGTFCRPAPRNSTIWADDLYMSVPFLARMGRLTGEQRYFEEAVSQVIRFNNYLYDDRSGLYFHCWYSDVELNGVAHWLRCNGWIALAQVELLDQLPTDHPRRKELITLLLRQIAGFSRFQDRSGLWHQLIDRPDSWLETSGTAMFVYAVARAVNRGWIPASYQTIARDGWKGLASKITADGQVEDVCIGTGIGDNIGFYYNRPKVLNEFHALGAVLLAGTEMIQLGPLPAKK